MINGIRDSKTGNEYDVGGKIKLVESGTKTITEDVDLTFDNELATNKIYLIILKSTSGYKIEFSLLVSTFYDTFGGVAYNTGTGDLVSYQLTTYNITFMETDVSPVETYINESVNYSIYELPFSL